LRLTVQSLRHPLTQALVVLTFTTGLIDGVSYLGLGRVFTANMTGNVVLLGFGIAGSGGLPVLAPVLSLGAFLVGSSVGGVLARRLVDHHQRHIAASLGAEVVLLMIAAVLTGVLSVRSNSASGDAVIALLALAMGVRNATVRRLAVPDLTTTVLTMTLTSLAAEAPVAGGSGSGSLRRVAAVAAMLAGAVVGALLLKSSLALPLVAAGGLALITWLFYVPRAQEAVGT
jgi:uncharacterized membrane protein YoaK (UPF0700 family)